MLNFSSVVCHTPPTNAPTLQAKPQREPEQTPFLQVRLEVSISPQTTHGVSSGMVPRRFGLPRAGYGM